MAATLKLTRKHARKVLEIVDQGLSEGKGEPIAGKMCVEAAVCFALGLPHGDDPPCVGKAVRQYKIRLNDQCGLGSMGRAKLLRRLAIAQLGSDTIDQKQFVRLLAEKAIRKLLPPMLREVAAAQWEAEPKQALLEAADRCEREGTREAAREAQNRAYAAYAAANAAYAARKKARERMYQIAADIGVEALIECGSPGCKWLDLCE